MNDFTAINNFFNHIYVITLHRATERQEAIKINLDGLNYEFFWGADKQDHPKTAMALEGVYDEALAIKNHRYHTPISHGHICCSWSHRKVYEDVLSKGYQKVLILEDDVMVAGDIGTLSPLVFNELPANWELLYLDYVKNENSNTIKQYWYHVQRFFGGINLSHTTIKNLYPKRVNQHVSSAGFHDFTSAYAITNAAAQKLLQLQTPIAYQADNLLAEACTTKLVNGFIARPKLFSQLSQGRDNLVPSFVDD